MEELYTEKVRELLYRSLEMSKQNNHYQVDICHLLKAFLEDRGSLLCNVLNKMDVNINRVNGKVDEYLHSIHKDSSTVEPKMS